MKKSSENLSNSLFWCTKLIPRYSPFLRHTLLLKFQLVEKSKLPAKLRTPLFFKLREIVNLKVPVIRL
jgi:hypothetical protein